MKSHAVCTTTLRVSLCLCLVLWVCRFDEGILFQTLAEFVLNATFPSNSSCVDISGDDVDSTSIQVEMNVPLASPFEAGYGDDAFGYVLKQLNDTAGLTDRVRAISVQRRRRQRRVEWQAPRRS